MSTSSSWIRAFSNAVWTAVTLNISQRLEDNSVLARRIEPENGIRRNVCVRTVKFARKTKTDEWRPSRGTCEIFSLFINGRYLRRPRSCVGHNCPSDTEYWQASGENRRVLDKGRRPRRTMDGRRRHRGRNSRARSRETAARFVGVSVCDRHDRRAYVRVCAPYCVRSRRWRTDAVRCANVVVGGEKGYDDDDGRSVCADLIACTLFSGRRRYQSGTAVRGGGGGGLSTCSRALQSTKVLTYYIVLWYGVSACCDKKHF